MTCPLLPGLLHSRFTNLHLSATSAWWILPWCWNTAPKISSIYDLASTTVARLDIDIFRIEFAGSWSNPDFSPRKKIGINYQYKALEDERERERRRERKRKKERERVEREGECNRDEDSSCEHILQDIPRISFFSRNFHNWMDGWLYFLIFCRFFTIYLADVLISL